MWCKVCQEDVPAVAPLEDPTQVVCARCRQPLTQRGEDGSPATEAADSLAQRIDQLLSEVELPAAEGDAHAANNAHDDASEEIRLLEQWEATLDELDRAFWESEELTLRAVSDTPQNPGSSPASSDQPCATVPPADDIALREHKKVPASAKTIGQAVCWLVIVLGMTLFSCGAVLFGWYFWEGASELGKIGLSIYLVGQVLLLIALLLQIDAARLWQRSTATSVEELRAELRHIQRATTMLASSHSPAAQSFYVHFAQRASPHILLADLKSQLDMLTMRLAEQEASRRAG